MDGWQEVETAQCRRCAIYTPVADLLVSPNGPYCVDCEVPEPIAWVAVPSPRVGHHARIVAAAMILVTLCFPLAACVSQL